MIIIVNVIIVMIVIIRGLPGGQRQAAVLRAGPRLPRLQEAARTSKEGQRSKQV